MGIVDKLKGSMNWENVTVISIFLGCCTAIIIVGSTIQNTTLANIMVAGGLVALGIPTSFMGSIGQKVAAAPMATMNTNSNPAITQKDVDDLRICLAETRNELLLLKSKVGDNNHE